jgi:hypothetical protein
MPRAAMVVCPPFHVPAGVTFRNGRVTYLVGEKP